MPTGSFPTKRQKIMIIAKSCEHDHDDQDHDFDHCVKIVGGPLDHG